MKVAISGLGSIGLRHAANLKTLGVTEIIGCDPDEHRRQQFGLDFDGPALADLSDALDQSPDLVVIASPNSFHIPQALAAARSGVPVFVEKPLGSSTDGLSDLKQEIEAQSLFCHVGSNWKFYPAFAEMKKLLDEGVIGPVAGIQVLAGHWLPGWHPERDYRKEYSARRDLGGGVILDTHELDYMTWLCGNVVASSCLSNQTGFLEISTEDVAAIALRFSSGAVGTLQIDYIQRCPRRRYNICGRDGTLEWELGKSLRVYLSEKEEWQDVPGTLEPDYNKMYLAQMQHVLDAIGNNTPPITGLAQAEHVLSTQLELKAAR